ncbi:hypothetical protein M406DRAFT_39085 [Cryphonectria parasitica EP155]|uniref:PAS domain-containing protein n=1 Tax=Cryphonectria parasitica (strain ATCC 38755 / EP155) TaxID=660469 RepID=A0A9P4Y6Y5_CRYP1|nr:uncharacterized protein M406DRAFT_39085 [Cryphonectria parasitica EP155]KAF3767863.1 hypothetical protein M406DRAFT_39085 [Cryphonectria parasitica EP155]
MEHTFMTIHNLTPDCNILFASESINDILGWRAEHVRGRSVFDYFHPDEVPFARSIHSRGILLDKAASLHYARVLSADGQWVSCECCFTVVHDVLVACTSIYRQGAKSERRAIEGAQIRRIFSSSPRDPRYHMLEHLSPKFQMPPVEREPRAALILNRFTRNLTIMFATNAVASVLGLSPEQVKDKSFYRCIQERCLPDALQCLESAKANDSIAYLRFWSRDPREEEDFEGAEQDSDDDEPMNEGDAGGSNSDSDDGGAALNSAAEDGSREQSGPPIKQESEDDSIEQADHRPRRPRNGRQPLLSVELEAVVSCTSDGLVVILRRARPPIPAAHPPLVLPPWDFENGLFAAPWAQQPVRPYVPPEMLYTFQAPLLPQYMPLRESVKAAGGPPIDHLMRSIRDVAVFAWGLVGINGNLASFAHGRPLGEAAPPGGLPIWDPRATNSIYQPPENQAAARWAYLESKNGKGKAPEPQQQQPPPPLSQHSSHFGPPGVAAPTGHHNPQHDRDKYLRETSNYTTQLSLYQHPGHGGLPPPYQRHNPFPGPLNQEPWGTEQQQERLPGASHGTFAIPTSHQPSHRPGSPAYDERGGS